MTNALFKDDFITEKVYRSSSDYSATDVKTEIKYNGFTLWDQKFNPNTRPKPPTAALKLGSMLHKAVLEPNEFNSYYQVIENKRTKEGKAKILELEEKGIEAISFEEKILCNDICDAVANHPIASELFSNGAPEQSFFWDHKETNLPLKCRADWINGDTIIDLKTTAEGGAHKDAFSRAVANFLYHIQAAHYCEGIGLKKFVFVAVEKVYPFNIGVYQLDEETIQEGLQVQKESLKRIKSYVKSGIWPGYNKPNEGIKTISIPYWAFKK